MCDCSAWRQVTKLHKDLNQCLYVKNTLAIRELQAKPYREFDVKCSDESVVTIRIEQQQSLGFEGSYVWGCGIALGQFLQCNIGRQWIQAKTVLELGSGTGCTAIVASLAGASRVVATDIAALVPLMQRNIDAVRSERELLAMEHLWGSNLEALESYLPVDVVILADVVYFSEHHASLVKSMNYIADRSPEVMFVLMHRVRSKEGESVFFEKLQTEAQLCIESFSFNEIKDAHQIHINAVDLDALCPNINLHLMTRAASNLDSIRIQLTSLTNEKKQC
jgi:predicted nicotinamide N-methyase